jgi:DNA primase
MEGPESFMARIHEARPFSAFFFERLSEGLDLQTIEGRAALAVKARPHLERIQAGVYRDMLEDRLAELVHRKSEIKLMPSKPRPDASSFASLRPSEPSWRCWSSTLAWLITLTAKAWPPSWLGIALVPC